MALVSGSIAEWVSNSYMSVHSCNSLGSIGNQPISNLLELARDNKLMTIKNVGKVAEEEILLTLKLQDLL